MKSLVLERKDEPMEAPNVFPVQLHPPFHETLLFGQTILVAKMRCDGQTLATIQLCAVA